MSELDQIRENINSIDEQMAQLFQKRMEMSARVADFKKERGLSIRDAERERELIDRNRRSIRDPAVAAYYVQFLRGILDLSCAYQSKLLNGMKVAYSGVKGAYGYLAARRMFPEAQLVAYPDFAAAHRAVELGEADSVVLPLENSCAGEVGAVMDLLFSGELYINQVLDMEIDHSLLGVEGAAAAAEYVRRANDPALAAIASEDATDSADAAKVTTVPDLVSLLGHTQQEAIDILQHGATAAEPRAVNEEGNPIKTEVRVALTDEPADTRTGTPTLYLGLDEDGAVVQAGYSAGTASLGYGTLSFSDAVKNESIIEKTLQEAGISVPAGTVSLPADKTEYSTYASDGTTLVKEYCPFSGDIDINGVSHTWSAVLSYDYSVANASGNLADTIRIIYVYINA